jgi:hypothetical protein
MRLVIANLLLPLIILAVSASDVSAQLNSRQARKLIKRMPGFELKSGAVRIKSISAVNGTSAEVSAEIEAVFKFEKNGSWHVAEIRTAPAQWEEIHLIASALKVQLASRECNFPDPPLRGVAAVDPSVKRARCILGTTLGVEVPSDAVRIKQINPMVVPLASRPSAVVVALIQTDIRFENDGKTGWHVAELRTGNREWTRVEPLVVAVNEEKQKRARAELEAIAKGLESFRAERGFYVVSAKEAVVLDHLNPRYLANIIRLDPWHNPYQYDGERDHFTLRSTGPDGKENTSDDIQLVSPSR